jgi:hypothetical protein
MSNIFDRKKGNPPQILVLYEKSDEKLHDDVMEVLSSLQCGGFVNLKSWYLSDHQKENVELKTRKLIRDSTVILVCCSPSLLRSRFFRYLVKRELHGKNLKKTSVIPVIVSPLLNDDFGTFKQYFSPFLPYTFPAGYRAIFYQRPYKEKTQLLIQLSEEVVTALEEKYFRPKPYPKNGREKIFVSYAKDDYRIAQAIRLYLDSVGIATCVEKCHRRGEDGWIDRTEDAINDAWASIVVLSKNAQRNQYVNHEWSFALGSNCSLVPIMTERITNLHPRLVPLQFLLWCFHDLENCPWSELVDRLEQIYLGS